ncbi:FkbM family methyltransferase [Patescibacteria group bacterium]|nr:FkbM family methyltransferase [Patescibacteria group bacterium]
MQKTLKFYNKQLIITYRDDSDLSVIDEFFVDKMYRTADSLIADCRTPILDIGAHIGMFSIYASILNPSVKIIALEPEPDNFKLLKQNLKKNHCKNIITKQVALVSPPQCHPDCSPDEVQDEMEGSLSTKNRDTTRLYLSPDTHTHSTIKPVNQSTNIEVPATNLEKLITQNKLKKIGLLKIDIEGAEYDIARNMQHETWNKIQAIVVEYHESEERKRVDLENIIRSHGFSIEHFPNHFDKRFGLLVCRNKKI